MTEFLNMSVINECPICYDNSNSELEWCQMNGCSTIQHKVHIKCIEGWWNSKRLEVRECCCCRAIVQSVEPISV